MRQSKDLGLVRIGVLGGIGPESTGLFYLRLIRTLQERGDIISNEDYPQMIINSIPGRELLSKRYSEKELETYVRGIMELEHVGVDFIVMACNTIHHYHGLLQSKTMVPILNLREEVSRDLEKRKIKSATVFGTPITIIKQLYKTKDVIYRRPSSEEIRQLSEAIYNFNRGFRREKQIELVNSLVLKHENKSDVVLISCTELSVMVRASGRRIDTMDILVDLTIKMAIGKAKNKNKHMEE
jgi:aspartate racemase